MQKTNIIAVKPYKNSKKIRLLYKKIILFNEKDKNYDNNIDNINLD